MKKMIAIMVLALSVSAVAGYDYVITGGYPDSIILINHQSLLMTGGAIDEIAAQDYSVLDIKNTTPFSPYPPGGIGKLDLGASSRLNFSGGELNGFYISGNATAVFSGGRINRIYSYQPNTYPNYQPGPHIEMKVRDYLLTGNTLTGHWESNTTFSIQLMNQAGYNPVIDNIKFTIIPEPLTLALLALGGVLIRRK